MRINARLDKESARKFEYLIENTENTASMVVKDAIATYYGKVVAEQEEAASVVERCGFVGCAEGNADLSSNYKEELSKSWSSKYDHC